MPRVYSDKRHYYFGEPSSLSSREVDWSIHPFVDFWSKARTGAVAPVYVADGRRHSDGFTAPIACYRYRKHRDNRDTYVLIQHGSYSAVDVKEQPLKRAGRTVAGKTQYPV